MVETMKNRVGRLERLSTAPGEARGHKFTFTVVGDVDLQDGDDVIFSKASDFHGMLQGGSGFRNVELHVTKVELMTENGKWKNITPKNVTNDFTFGNNNPEEEGGENATAGAGDHRDDGDESNLIENDSK